MLLLPLLRAPAGSRLVRTDFDGMTLTLGIATTHPSASCPALRNAAAAATASPFLAYAYPR